MLLQRGDYQSVTQAFFTMPAKVEKWNNSAHCLYSETE